MEPSHRVFRNSCLNRNFATQVQICSLRIERPNDFGCQFWGQSVIDRRLDAPQSRRFESVAIVVDHNANARSMLSDPSLYFLRSVAAQIRCQIDPQRNAVPIKSNPQFRRQVICQAPRGSQDNPAFGQIHDPLQLPQMGIAQSIRTRIVPAVQNTIHIKEEDSVQSSTISSSHGS